MAVLSLDDSDPSIIYSAGWARAGSSREYNSTTTWTIAAGATARLNFQGTSVAVYGTIGPRTRGSIAPESTYSVDGGTPVKFVADQGRQSQYSQQFFQSPVMTNEPHTLTIAHSERTDPFFLDLILVVVPSGPVAPTIGTSSNASSTSTSTFLSSSSSSGSSSTASTTTTTPVPSPTTPAPTPDVTTTIDSSTNLKSEPSGTALDSTGASKSGPNAGAIAGGIIAAIIGLFIIIVGVIFWRRKQNRRNSIARTKSFASSRWGRPPQTPPAEPFVLAPPPPRKPTMAQAASPSPSASYTAQWAASGGAYGGYTEDSYTQGAYTKDAYAQGAYANDSYTAAAYTKDAYTQGGYGQGGYGQSGYGQSAYPQNAYSQAGGSSSYAQPKAGGSGFPFASPSQMSPFGPPPMQQPSRGYASPSQIINQEQSGRTRIRLDE